MQDCFDAEQDVCVFERKMRKNDPAAQWQVAGRLSPVSLQCETFMSSQQLARLGMLCRTCGRLTGRCARPTLQRSGGWPASSSLSVSNAFETVMGSQQLARLV